MRFDYIYRSTASFLTNHFCLGTNTSPFFSTHLFLMLHQCQEQPLRGTLNAFSNIFLPFWVCYTPAAQSCFQWCTNGLGSSKRSTSISNTCQDLEPQQQMTTHGEKNEDHDTCLLTTFFFLEEGIMRTEEYSLFWSLTCQDILFADDSMQCTPCWLHLCWWPSTSS